MTTNPLFPSGSPAPPYQPPGQARPLPRPTLLPGLRRLWRGRHQLQLGVDPARAVVLELPDARVANLLELLDGTRSERSVVAEAAARYQIRQADARALLDTLREAGLVVGAQSLLPNNLPDPVRRRLAQEAAALALRGSEQPATPAQLLRRRHAARVVIAGYGQLVAPVAVALARAGIGHVSGKPVAEIASMIRQLAPGTGTGPLRRRDTTFVVQIGSTGPAVLTAAGYAHRRMPHLAVSVRDGTAVVGPLVPPAGSPCLNCIELHRQDRDPQWPLLAAQLASEPPGGTAGGAGGTAAGTAAGEPCAATTALAAASIAANEVLSWLDGASPSTIGASIEVAAPGELRRRSWPAHPRCHCLPRAATR